MLPALVLCIAIRAEFWPPLRNKERQNGSNINISVLSSTEWTHRHQKVANSYVGVTLKRRQKCPKIHVLLLLLLLRHTFFCPGYFSGIATDTSISNIPLEPQWPVDETFVTLVDIISLLGGQISQNHPKRGVNRHFQAKLAVAVNTRQVTALV